MRIVDLPPEDSVEKRRQEISWMLLFQLLRILFHALDRFLEYSLRNLDFTELDRLNVDDWFASERDEGSEISLSHPSHI